MKRHVASVLSVLIACLSFAGTWMVGGGLRVSGGAAGPANPTLLWWKMTNGSGTTVTATVGPNGTTDATWTSSTQSGGGFALDFNGSSSDAVTNSNVTFGTSVITITFWMWSAGFNSNSYTFQLSGGAGSAIANAFAFHDFGVLGFELYGDQFSGSREESIAYPSTSTWHFFAIVLDNSTATGDIKVYLDGVAQTTSLDTNTKTGSGNFTADVIHVGSPEGTSAFFSGRLDDIRIYNSELSPTDITALNAAGAQ